MFNFVCVTKAGRQSVSTPINLAILGGLTGQPEPLQRHIEELKEIGIPIPTRIPIFFRVSASLVTQAASIQVIGDHTSGEAEPIVLSFDDELWLGVGSDHTDRKFETVDVALSKQLCGKVIGQELWPLDEVLPHWDQLRLRSYILEGGEKVIYQDGLLSGMRRADDLMTLMPSDINPLPRHAMLMCGTLPAHGGIRPSNRFIVELQDPVLNRSMRCEYEVVALTHEI